MSLNVILHVLVGTADGMACQHCTFFKPAADILFTGAVLSGELVFIVVAMK